MPESLRTAPAAERGFRTLWSAAALSALGDGLRYVVFPLMAAAITTDPRVLGTVFAAGYLPWPLFGLFAGALVDRADRRELMWRVNLARAVVVALFAALVAGRLESWVALAVVSFALGVAETLFDNASTAFVPQLVEPDRLARANSSLFAVQTLNATLIGTPLGVLLFGIEQAVPLLAVAVSFAAAGALIRTIQGGYRPVVAEPGAGLLHEVSAGVRWLWRHRLLRTACLLLFVINATLGAGEAMLVVYNRVELKQEDFGYSLLLIALAAGAIAGSVAAPWLRRGLGIRTITGAAVAAQAVALLTAGLISSYPLALAAMAVVGAASACWNVTIVSYRQAAVPAALLGRVTSSNRVIAISALPVGAEIGGVLAHRYGLHAPYLTGGCVLIVATLLALRGLGPESGGD